MIEQHVYMKEDLYEYIYNIGVQLKYVVIKSGYSFVCNRADRPNDGVKTLKQRKETPKEKKRKSHSYKCDCKWAVRYQEMKDMKIVGKIHL